MLISPRGADLKVSKNTAYSLVAVSAVLWATNGTFTVLAIDGGATPLQISVFVTLLTSVLLVALIATLDPKSLMIKRKDFWAFFVFAVVTGSLFAIAWYLCVDRTGVATAYILLYLYPSIVTIASVFLLNEKLTAQKAVALPLTFVGCVIVAGAQAFESEGLSFDLVGVLLGVYTAFSGALYYLWGKKFLDSGYSGNTVVLYMYVLSIPALVILANPADLVKINMNTDAWLYLLAMAVFPGVIAFTASMVALNHLEASKASIIASIEPVAAVAIAFIVLSESMSGLQIGGVMLVFVGVLLLRLTSKEERAEPPGPQDEVLLEK